MTKRKVKAKVYPYPGSIFASFVCECGEAIFTHRYVPEGTMKNKYLRVTVGDRKEHQCNM